MKFFIISKLILILIIPFLIFLGVANMFAFDKSYYASKLSEYKISIPDANSINGRTIDFVSGKGNELPEIYNARERQHLNDVRNAVKVFKTNLYFLILLFVALFLMSALILGVKNNITNFTGKVLAYGGILTIVLAALLFILISLNFSSVFDSFHTLFFRQGTYTFDPAKEVIVNLYPEQFFMDIGLRISKLALFASSISTIAGTLLIYASKSKKNKNRRNTSKQK